MPFSFLTIGSLELWSGFGFGFIWVWVTLLFMIKGPSPLAPSLILPTEDRDNRNLGIIVLCVVLGNYRLSTVPPNNCILIASPHNKPSG